MRRRRVVISPEAQTDLRSISRYVRRNAGSRVSRAYVRRIERFCLGLERAAERGRPVEGVRSGLRIVGFERRLTIAFAVHADRVDILRVFSFGQDWEGRLSERGDD